MFYHTLFSKRTLLFLLYRWILTIGSLCSCSQRDWEQCVIPWTLKYRRIKSMLACVLDLWPLQKRDTKSLTVQGSLSKFSLPFTVLFLKIRKTSAKASFLGLFRVFQNYNKTCFNDSKAGKKRFYSHFYISFNLQILITLA
jgi:hypothetical protein